MLRYGAIIFVPQGHVLLVKSMQQGPPAGLAARIRVLLHIRWCHRVLKVMHATCTISWEQGIHCGLHSLHSWCAQIAS